jgi:predicted GNAT family N-acyltransferase
VPITLVDYGAIHHDRCVAICRSNCPDFFVNDDIAEFGDFLHACQDPYYVLVADGEVVACGGIYLKAPGVAGLSWGMVDRARHGSGAGKALLLERMLRCRAVFGACSITLNTSAKTAPFFARFGFAITRTVADGYGAGIDKVVMTHG